LRSSDLLAGGLPFESFSRPIVLHDCAYESAVSLLVSLNYGGVLVVFDVRPRLRSDIGVEDEDGSMLTFIKGKALLPAERSRQFRSAEPSVPFEIYQGNRRTAADNRHLRDLNLVHMSQEPTRFSSLSLEVREDGSVVGRARERDHPDNERSFRYIKAGEKFGLGDGVAVKWGFSLIASSALVYKCIILEYISDYITLHIELD